MPMFMKPSDQRVAEFLEAQSRLKFTYGSVGTTTNGDSPAGYTVDHNRVRLGTGRNTFDVARRALREWQQFRLDWIELQGAVKNPEPDQTVTILARALGLWVLNACRVVYVVEEDVPVRRFAFAYGTLPDHVELGEERFQVEWHRDDDSVWYDILAFSRPNKLIARLAYPYVRLKQKQFARDSKLAMQSAVNDGLSSE